jgi:hypothetical protein
MTCEQWAVTGSCLIPFPCILFLTSHVTCRKPHSLLALSAAASRLSVQDGCGQCVTVERSDSVCRYYWRREVLSSAHCGAVIWFSTVVLVQCRATRDAALACRILLVIMDKTESDFFCSVYQLKDRRLLWSIHACNGRNTPVPSYAVADCVF